MENTSNRKLMLVNSIFTIVLRVLGLVLIFPLALILTNETLILLLVVFLQYIVVFRIILMGIPSGFKELTSRAYEAKDFKAEIKLFVISLIFTLILSIGGFFIIRNSHVIIRYESIIDDLIRINKLLSISIIVSAVLSIFKAFLRPRLGEYYTLGNVIYRGLIILSVIIAIFFSISTKMTSGSLVYIIGIGLLSSSSIVLCYFGYHFYKLITDIKYSYDYENKDTAVKVFQLLIYLFKYSLPYVMMFAALPLYRLFDIYLLQSIITPKMDAIIETARYQFNVYYLLALFSVIVTITASVYIGRVGADFSVNNLSGVDKNINKSLQYVLYFTLPLAAYLMMFSDQVYGIIFSNTSVLTYAAPIVILIPLFIITSRLVNIINKSAYLWYSILFGLLVKVFTTYALSIYLGINGAVIATHIGLLSTIVINLVVLKTVTLFDLNFFVKRLGYLLLITGITFGLLYVIDILFASTLDYSISILNNLLYILITFVITIVLYFVMSLYSGLFRIVGEADITIYDVYDQIEEWEDDELLW